MITPLVVQFLVLPLLLAAIYPYVIGYKRYPRRTWAAAIAWVLDVYLNYTTLAVYMLDFPRKHEYTFSQRLKRLRFDFGWRGFISEHIIVFLNHFDPDHV